MQALPVCPTCKRDNAAAGIEFAAPDKLPPRQDVKANASPTIRVTPEPSRKPQNKANPIAIGCVAVGAIVMLFCCGGLPNTDSPSVSNRASVGTGDVAVLRSGSGVMVTVTESAYDRMNQLSVAKDSTGLAQLALAGLIFIVPDGTECRVIDRGLFTSEVRILSGENAGQSGFVASDFLKN